MAYGVPVLSHDDFEDQGPEVEAIVPGETGALYRSGDFEDLTRKIENWIREHPTREDVAARCIAQIENRYNADRQAMVIDAAVRGTPASAVETAVSAGRNP
jgi:glycosyltransferase involved in cell wall biosynthesis